MGVEAAARAPTRSSPLPRSSDNQNAHNRVPTEDELTSLFDEAMKRAPTDSNASKTMTKDEQAKFLKAMGDREFRSLLNDYMMEISDPANRAETEQYLAQLEREEKVPTDKTLIKPTPGFVVKTKWDDREKLFVNICASEKLQPPSSAKVETGPRLGTSWSLPYSVGPERLEPDKSGTRVVTYDVCFHPRTLQFATTQKPYRDMVVKTALDAIEPLVRVSQHKPSAVVSRDYHVLKGVTYKSGEPVTMCLTTPSGGEKEKQSKSETKKSVVEAKKPERLEPTRSDEAEAHTIRHEAAVSTKPLIEEVTTRAKIAPKALSKLEYRVVYRGKFEMMDHMQANLHSHETPAEVPTRPRELVVEISFPNHASAKGIDLDVNDRAVKVETAGYEPLEVCLPFAVIEEKGGAKFDKKVRKLVVTLPVQPPEPVPVKRMAIVEHDDDEEEEEQTQEKASALEDNEVHSVQTTATTTTTKAASTPVPRDDAFAMLRETALMVANDPMYLPREPVKASFTTLEEAAPTSTEPVSLHETVKAHVADDALYDDLPPLESCSEDEDEVEMDLQDTLAMEGPKPVLDGPKSEVKCSSDARIFYKTPQFTVKETRLCLSYLVEVANVDSASVSLEFPSNTSLRVRFSTTDDHFELQVNSLRAEIDSTRSEIHAATENFAIVLYKATTAADVANIEPTPTPPPVVRFQNDLLYNID